MSLQWLACMLHERLLSSARIRKGAADTPVCDCSVCFAKPGVWRSHLMGFFRDRVAPRLLEMPRSQMMSLRCHGATRASETRRRARGSSAEMARRTERRWRGPTLLSGEPLCQWRHGAIPTQTCLAALGRNPL